MELLFVHLTDIHIQDDNDFEVLEGRISSLAGAICEHITSPEETAVFLCVTGDFAYSGKENQYTCASLLISEIERIIEQNKKPKTLHKIFVPGNHDCDFDDPDNTVRETLLESPMFDVENPVLFTMCTKIQKNFYDFAKTEGALYPLPDRVLSVNEISNQELGLHIYFHCINTGWCSSIHETKGKMRIHFEPIESKEENSLVITLMHHDAEWLDWNDRSEWDNYQRKYCISL